MINRYMRRLTVRAKTTSIHATAVLAFLFPIFVNIQSSSWSLIGYIGLVSLSLALLYLVIDGNRKQKHQPSVPIQDRKWHIHPLKVLNELATELSHITDSESAFNIVARMTPRIIEGDHVSVALLDESREFLDIFSLDGCSGAIPTGKSWPIEETMLGLVVTKRRVMFALVQAGEQWDDVRQLNELGFESLLSAPLNVAGKSIGALNLASNHKGLKKRHQKKTMLQIAAMLAATLENQRLLEQTRAALVRAQSSQKALTRAKQVIESSPVVILRWKADEKWSVDLVSDNVTQFGYSPEEITSGLVSYGEIVHPDDLPRVRAEERRYVGAGIYDYAQEFRLLSRSGKIHWVDLHITIDHPRNGEPAYFQGTLVDITERKEFEEALRNREEQFREMLGRLPTPIALSRSDGELVFVNQSFAQLFGSDPETAIREYSALDHFADPLNIEDIFEQLRNDGSINNYEIQFKRYDGTLFWGTISVYPFHFLGDTMFLCSLYDLSIHKQTEELLLEAKEAAESANLAKSSFLSNMTHELRTPMNGVLGMTSLLLDTALNDEQFEIVNTIRSSGDTLLSIISDILDFSKVEADKLELELFTFNLERCIRETIDFVAHQASEKQLRLSYQVDAAAPDWIVQDVTRVRQILANLLSNAVKFTERGEIVVKVRTEPLDGNRFSFEISVSDTGIGIPVDRRELIFESFSQADPSTTRRFGGTGLGLAISKQLSEKLGGTMWLESEEGIGSTFYFTLIAEKAADMAPARQGSSPHKFDLEIGHRHPLKILLAEDNIVNQKVAMGILKKHGFQADLASNGMEVLNSLKGNSYDVILMDVSMPDMDGITATKKIRAEWPADRQPFIIAMTANAMPGDRERLLASGMNEYVSKPINVAQFIDILSNVAVNRPHSHESMP